MLEKTTDYENPMKAKSEKYEKSEETKKLLIIPDPNSNIQEWVFGVSDDEFKPYGVPADWEFHVESIGGNMKVPSAGAPPQFSKFVHPKNFQKVIVLMCTTCMQKLANGSFGPENAA